jgi:hypothetical protein
MRFRCIALKFRIAGTYLVVVTSRRDSFIALHCEGATIRDVSPSRSESENWPTSVHRRDTTQGCGMPLKQKKL